MTGATWCSISHWLQNTFDVSGTTVQSLSNYHVAQKWLWHSSTMALPEWWGGRPWVKDEQRLWKTDGSLGTAWEKGKKLHQEKQLQKNTMQHPGTPNPIVKKCIKKAQECGLRIGGIGAQRRHEVIHSVSRDSNQPNTFYVLKTGSLCLITPPEVGKLY